MSSYSATNSLLRDKVDTPKFALMENISEVEKLKFSNLLLNEVNLIVVSSNSVGKITYVSPASEKIIGYKPETLQGDNWWDLTYFNKEEAQEW